MPENGLTPEQEKWAQQVLKHYKLPDPMAPKEARKAKGAKDDGVRYNEVKENAAYRRQGRVMVSRNVRDEAAQHSAHFTAEFEKIRARYQGLVVRTRQIEGKTQRVLLTDEHKSAFMAARDKVRGTFQKLEKNYKQPEATASHVSLLKTLMDKIEYDLTEVEKVYKQSCDHADKLLQTEMAEVLAFQKSIEQIDSHRGDLEAANIDLKRFDKVSVSANALHTQMLKAAKEHNLTVLKSLKKWMKNTGDAFRKAYEIASKEAEQAKEKLQKAFEKLRTHRSELSQKQSDIEHLPDLQSEFLLKLSELETEAPNGEKLLSRGNCKGAAEILERCENLLFSAQLIWLKNTQSESTEAVDTPEKGKPVSTFKKIQNLQNDLDRAMQRSHLLRKSSPHGSEYDTTCKQLKSQLTDAQAALIAGNIEEVEESILPLRKLRFQLYGWALNAQDKLDWSHKQLTELEEETHQWQARRADLKALSISSELATESFKAFESELAEIQTKLETAKTQLQNLDALSAQPLMQEIVLHLRKLSALAAEIELD